MMSYIWSLLLFHINQYRAEAVQGSKFIPFSFLIRSPCLCPGLKYWNTANLGSKMPINTYMKNSFNSSTKS